MIQRGSNTSNINLWNLLLYTIISILYRKCIIKIQSNHITDKAENNKLTNRNEESVRVCVCVCACFDAGWCLVSTYILND